MIDARAMVAWTLRSSSRVSGRLLRLELGGGFRFLRNERAEVSLAALADALHADSPAEDPEDEWVFGGLATASYALVEAPWAVTAGLFASVHPGRVDVDRGSETVFSIPWVTGGAVVEFRPRIF